VVISGLRTIEIALLCEVPASFFAVLLLPRRATQRELRFARNDIKYNPMLKICYVVPGKLATLDNLIFARS